MAANPLVTGHAHAIRDGEKRGLRPWKGPPTDGRATTRYIDVWPTASGGTARTLSTSGPGRPATPARSTWSRHGRWKRRRTRDSFVRQPDPKSRAGYTRLIGHSPSASAVLTVIVDPYVGSGVTAWTARGPDLRHYLDSKESRND
jgi:hypothetical protein